MTSPAMERFLKSMKIGFIEWHDGIGYDLEALKELEPEERRQIEATLIAHKDSDWREVDALAALGTPAAIAALQECLYSPNLDVRLFAVRHLKVMGVADRIEEVVVATLPLTKIGQGMTFALALAEKYPTEKIRHTLLWACLDGNDDIRVHCAALALFLYGQAASNFDTHQKIVYEFREAERARRLAAFDRLCRQIGVADRPDHAQVLDAIRRGRFLAC